MSPLSELKEENFIAIAKIIDNNFIGNKKIVVHPLKTGIVKVTGYSCGWQCINCEVKIDIYMNELKGAYTQDESDEGEAFRDVQSETLVKIREYLEGNGFQCFPN